MAAAATAIKKPDNNSPIVNVLAKQILNKLLWSVMPYILLIATLFIFINFLGTLAAVALVHKYNYIYNSQ